MSKFLITNAKELSRSCRNNIKQSKFSLNFDYEKDGLYALTTRKLGVQNENAYQEGNDFVIINGTLVYDGVSGVMCLKKLLMDFKGDINSVREKCIGNYAICINKNGIITVFGEAAACYDIFYYHNGEAWAISSSIAELAKILWDKLTINKLNVLEAYARYAILNNETVFNEIYRLPGNNSITINNNVFTINKVETPFKDGSDYNSTIDAITKDMKYVAKTLSENYGTPTISMTGGMDSRMSLASYLAAGVKPRIVYGLGDSSIAVSGKNDCNVDRLYSEKFGLEFEVFPWNETKPLDKYWHQYVEDYDEGTITYGGNKDTIDYFFDPKSSFCEYGFWGEFYRDAGWLLTKNDKDYVTIEDFAEKWYLKSMEENVIEKYPGLKQHIVEKLYKVCENHGMNPMKLSSSDLILLALNYYQRAHSLILNFVNRYKYCHYVMSESCIVFNTNVPCTNRKKGKLIIDILMNLYPQVLDIPIYSGWKYYKFNRITKTIELDTKNAKGIILKYVPKKWFEFVYRLIKYRTMPEEFVALLNNNEYQDIVNEFLPDVVLSDLKANKHDNSPFVVRLLIQGLLFKHWSSFKAFTD